MAPHIRSILTTGFLGLLTSGVFAQLQPGAVFREYHWRPRSPWQRVTGPDAKAAAARQFLPNPVNKIRIDDLEHATRIEVHLEKLQSHAGTADPRVRINGNGWLWIPEPDPKSLPGTRGRGGVPNTYQTMTYPVVPVHLSQVKQGENTFEFTCRGGSILGGWWPQWLVYGVTFRVYYDPAKKAHPTGTVTSPGKSSRLGDNPTFSVSASGPNGIQQVDLVGDYYDFDWRGEGREHQWQYHTLFGEVRKHIGSDTQAPWSVRWDTTWIPTQPGPFRVVARIVDKTGMVYVTPAVEDLILARPKTVIRYRNTKVPQHWQTRENEPKDWNETNVTHDLKKAEAARLFLVTWNGYENQEVRVNDRKVHGSLGKNHDLDYNAVDFPLSQVRAGRNELSTVCRTTHHGIEVQWPGIELFIRYDFPEVWASYEAFGQGCKGAGGIPLLAATGRPVLGETMYLQAWYGQAWSPVAVVSGLSSTAWGSLKLPLDLGFLGGPGCLIYTAPEYSNAAVSNQVGLVTLPLTLPNDRRLMGITWYNQAIWRDSLANPLGWVTSNGGKGFVHDR